MELIVRVGDREEKVRVRQRRDRFEVMVGDSAYRVDERSMGPGRSSLLIDGRQHDVTVLRNGDGSYRIGSSRGETRVEVMDPLTHLARKSARGAGGRRRQQITAYMPGRVVSIFVGEGDTVAAGDGLVVLEAMKMENEIRAEHDGVVKRVAVTEGQAVEGGDLLFELE